MAEAGCLKGISFQNAVPGTNNSITREILRNANLGAHQDPSEILEVRANKWILINPSSDSDHAKV